MRWLLVCALLLCGCGKPVPPRILHIRVAAGPEIRQQANWRELIASRIQAASAILSPRKIQLEMAAVTEWEPDPKLSPEMQRWSLAGFHSSGSWLDLGFNGSTQQSNEPGLAVPFDARALIFSLQGASEPRQAAALAHEIVHILGGWHTSEGGSVMSLPPGDKIDSTTASCLNATRDVDLRQGAGGLDSKSIQALQKVFTSSKGAENANPLYRFYSSTGLEAERRGLRTDAEVSFKDAVKYGPDLAKAHLDLGNAQLATRAYSDAADEFRLAARLDPKSGPAMSGLAASLLGAGQRGEALQTLQKSIQMNPSDPAPHANIGVVLAGTPGRLDEGIAELQKALSMDPNSPGIKRSLDAALAAKTKAGAAKQ